MPVELDASCSAIIHTLFNQAIASTPISSFNLLARVIAATKDGQPRLRVTELDKFESILEGLEKNWEHGTLALARDVDVMNVVQVSLGSTSTSGLFKRKRVVDEDADSAAGDEFEEPPRPASREIRDTVAILKRPTAKGRLMAEEYRSPFDTFEPICIQITKADCSRARGTPSICERIHFRPLMRPHTDPSLGHCSYLNTCYSEPTYAQSPSMVSFTSTNRGPASLPSGLGAGGRGKEKAPCRYLHFEVDWDEGDAPRKGKDVARTYNLHKTGIGRGLSGKEIQPGPAQWMNCDVRRLDYSVLGKFHAIMADPPWDIHMSLPYGTMTDDEMRAMPIPALQDEGFLFLWVTGRAMEVGRECMRHWGYTRVDEVVWVKTNQLQRVIRTGRTGHWLNHTKEHMLVGVKTQLDANGQPKLDANGGILYPKWANRGLDTDVIVSEVRETSRKPDEAYGLIERMCPGGRKIEIFGRKHNTRPGWLTLGNQLGPDQIHEEDLAARINSKYPEKVVGEQMVE